MRDVRFKIDQLLPVVFAVTLPLFGFVTNSRIDSDYYLQFSVRWLIASIVLYIIWHVLELIGRRSSKASNILLFLALAVILVLAIMTTLNDLKFGVIAIMRLSFVIILIIIFQKTIQFQNNIAHLNIEKERLQTENYKAQLKALTNQIDPHFLFNSLNTLRSLIRQDHSGSEKFVMSLSDLYRQSLKHHDHVTLPLSEELEVLDSFIYLMKTRNENTIEIDISIDTELYDYHLPSLALQIIVENCFKHNTMAVSQPLKIKIRSMADSCIMVSNNIQPKLDNDGTSGHGLELLKKRYSLMGVHNGVIVKSEENEFKVSLRLIER